MMTAVMRVEFDCGEVLFYEPHMFQLLPSQFASVKHWVRMVVARDVTLS